MHLAIATQILLIEQSVLAAPDDPASHRPTEDLPAELEARFAAALATLDAPGDPIEECLTPELVAAAQAAAPSTDQHTNRAQRRAAARGKGRSDAQRRNPRNPRSRR